MRKNHKGFAVLEALLILLIIGMLIGVGWYVYAARRTTNTTANNEGIGELCVDNTDTRISVSTDPATKTKTANVNIGKLYTRGFIVHNGRDGARTNRAFGQRVGELFGGDGNQNIKAGLDLVAEKSFALTPCVEEAMPLAKKGLKKHYEREVKAITEGAITNVNITFNQTPPHQRFPTGHHINAELEQTLGIDLPDNWGINVGRPDCTAQIDGKPAIAH